MLYQPSTLAVVVFFAFVGITLGLSFGGSPSPIYSPGMTSTLLPDLGATFSGGVGAGTSLLRATPDIAGAIADDPTSAPDVIEAHQGEIGAVKAAATAGSAIYDIPRRPAPIDVRFRFNLSIAPFAPPDPTVDPTTAPPPPPGGVTFSGVLQVTNW